MRRIAITTAAAAVVGLSGALTTGCSGGSSGGGAGAGTAPTSSNNPTNPTPGPAFRTLDRGTETGVATTSSSATARVASTAAVYSQLWTDHQSFTATPAARPTVDHATETVVGVFLGARPDDGYGVEVTGVAEVQSGAQTLLEVSYVQQQVTPVTGNPSNPFHIIAVDRTGVDVALRDATPASQQPAPAPGTPTGEVHGELVEIAGVNPAVPTVLGFMPDNGTDPWEIADPSALTAAGLHAGHFLSLEGETVPNDMQLTTVSTRLRVASFEVDTHVFGGALGTPNGVVNLVAHDGTSFTPTGPMAPLVFQQPVGRVLLVTGRLDPNFAPAAGQGEGLLVTSFRPSRAVHFSETLAAGHQVDVTVTDLDVLGAYAVRGQGLPGATAANRVQYVRSGGRRMVPAVLTNLRDLITTANLRAQPASFPSAVAATTVQTVTLEDDQGSVTVTVEVGAVVPPELQALLDQLVAFSRGQGLPSLRLLAQGDTSAINMAAGRFADTQAELDAVWAMHAPGTAAPVVDFAQDVVIGAFLGPKATDGFRIDVETIQKIGPAFYLTSAEVKPAPGAVVTAVTTTPFTFVALDASAGGPIHLDGQTLRQ